VVELYCEVTIGYDPTAAAAAGEQRRADVQQLCHGHPARQEARVPADRIAAREQRERAPRLAAAVDQPARRRDHRLGREHASRLIKHTPTQYHTILSL
jgi:hypothetical protein